MDASNASPSLRIALLAPEQHVSFEALLGELHVHYHGGAAPAPHTLRAHLHERLLGAGSPLQLVVASDAQGRAVGFAAILFLHSLVEPAAPLNRQCQMKELFVSAPMRGQGVGRALMAWVAREAVRRGCCRVDWHVQAANHAGLAFYARLGARRVEGRLNFRLEAGAMLALGRTSAQKSDDAQTPAAAGDAALAGVVIDAPTVDRVLLRSAGPDDALCLSVLAMQVFLDTYATQGIRPALAREALAGYSEASFRRAIADAQARLWVAELDAHLIGFAHVTLGAVHPLAPAGVQAELLRLYVQEPFTGRGVGSRLLERAEQLAVQGGADVLWLTPWVHNHRAIHFYERRGYRDHGCTHFTFEGETHENRVHARTIAVA